MNFHGGIETRDGLVDFSVNIPPLQLPKSYEEMLMGCVQTLHLYPDIDGGRAKQKLAEVMGLTPEHYIIGNGATELIYLLGRTFSDKRVLIVEPTFTEYRRAFEPFQTEIVHFETHVSEGFEIDDEALVDAINRFQIDLVVLCNPNNPTGIFTDAERFEGILQRVDNSELIWVVDESFLDFVTLEKATRYQSALLKLAEAHNVFSLRSLTKTYSVPGLRIAYGVGNAALVEKLNRYKEPWSINTFALKSLTYFLEDDTHLKRVAMWLESEKAFLTAGLLALPEIKVYEGAANFVLIHYAGDAEAFYEGLHKAGVHVRTCFDFQGLGRGYFRIAVRLREDNVKLLSAMAKTLERLS